MEHYFVRTLGVMLSGDTIDVRDFYSRPIQDDTFLMLLNSHYETVNFVLPGYLANPQMRKRPGQDKT